MQPNESNSVKCHIARRIGDSSFKGDAFGFARVKHWFCWLRVLQIAPHSRQPASVATRSVGARGISESYLFVIALRHLGHLWGIFRAAT
jgi:hypothetical protein